MVQGRKPPKSGVVRQHWALPKSGQPERQLDPNADVGEVDFSGPPEETGEWPPDRSDPDPPPGWTRGCSPYSLPWPSKLTNAQQKRFAELEEVRKRKRRSDLDSN